MSCKGDSANSVWKHLAVRTAGMSKKVGEESREAHQASLGKLEARERSRIVAHARGAEQAMPPGPTLDGVGRLAERERPGTVTLINAEPRSLSARSAHPPQSRAASSAPLARRNVGVDLRGMTKGLENGSGASWVEEFDFAAIILHNGSI